MKKVKRSFLVFLTLVLMLSTARVVNAEDQPGVVRSGDTNTWTGTDENGANIFTGDKITFTENAPLGTVTIETGRFSILTNDDYTFEALNENFAIGTRSQYIDDAWRHTPAVVYAPALEKDTKVELSGDLFSLTFPKAATLQNGESRDVKVTVSNMKLGNYGEEATIEGNDQFQGIAVCEGNWMIICQVGTGYIAEPTTDEEKAIANGNALVAMDCDLTIEVLGAPEGSTLVFATNDLDIRGTDKAEALMGETYNEALAIVDGRISEIYIPTKNYLTQSTYNGGVKFEAAANTNAVTEKGVDRTEPWWADQGTYNSGFAVLTNAASTKFHWWGNGRGMGTNLFTTNIKYKIVSTTGKGGTIKTTTSGDLKDLDTEKELGPGTVDVPVGKNVSYVMEPEKGYKLGTITVDGKTIDPDDKTTWPENIDVTEDENGNPVVTFKDNRANHDIHVEWEPMKYKVNYDGNGATNTMTPQDFTGADETMKTKANEFIRPGYAFKGFKLLDKEGKPIKDESGKEITINDPEDLKDMLIEMGDGAEVTLQAQWEPKNYKISYLPNGGTGTMNPDKFTGADKTMKNKENQYERIGHSFIGFRVLDKDGNHILDENGEVLIVHSVEDLKNLLLDYDEIILEALWAPRSYSVPYSVPKTGIE